MAANRGMQITDEIVYRNKRWKDFHDQYVAEANRKKDEARAADIIEEGRRQHHCVGAHDRYMKEMSARESFILFLRKAEDPQTPYYTIQTDIQRIQQFYAAYDRQPDKEIVEKIMTAWLKQVKQNYRQIIEEEGKEVLHAAG